MTSEQFKTIRKSLGFKQAELAEILGLSSRNEHISRIENGVSPVTATMAKLMTMLSQTMLSQKDQQHD